MKLSVRMGIAMGIDNDMECNRNDSPSDPSVGCSFAGFSVWSVADEPMAGRLGQCG